MVIKTIKTNDFYGKPLWLELLEAGFPVFDAHINGETDVPRYVENPEWTKKQNEKKIQDLKDLIDSYEQTIIKARKQLKELEEPEKV